MKAGRIVFPLACFICSAVLPLFGQGVNEETADEQPMLRAAIFVQNRAGAAYEDKIDVLNDLITARLTEKGFSVLDKQYVAERFREARDRNAEMKKTIEALTGGEVDFTLDDALKDASALRLAQMVGADYIIVATITSIGHTEKTFTGQGTTYGVNNKVTDYTARVGLRVLEAARGGSVYGDVIKASERIPETDNLKVVSSDIIDNLLDAASGEIADNIGRRMKQIEMAKAAQPGAVPFKVSINGVEGATIELDGAAIGASGTEPAELYALPGIHSMRVTREWFDPWEKPVNIQADQTLTVALELSDAGIARFKDLEGFKTAMAIAKEKSAADAYAKRLIAEGEKKRLEESYEKIDTSNVERLSVGDNTPRVIVEEEEAK